MQYVIETKYVLVNGTQVRIGCKHTDALPGKVVRSPEWEGH